MTMLNGDGISVYDIKNLIFTNEILYKYLFIHVKRKFLNDIKDLMVILDRKR